MKIIKRDGSKQSFMPNKILSRIKTQSIGLSIKAEKLFQRVIPHIKDGMTATDIDEIIAFQTADLQIEHPDYAILGGRIFGLLGESGAGKSFIAYSICKSAQRKQDYSVIYIDTENSIDIEGIAKMGIDNSPEKFRLIRSNKVEDINMSLTQLLDDLKEAKLGGYEMPKLLIVLDSIGMMSSNKEKEDLLKGAMKQDMTRAKGLNALFRSISSDLGYLDIPMICCNHTYLSQDLFPKEISKGGMGLVYSASVLGFLSKSKLKDGTEDEMDLGQSGISVLFKTWSPTPNFL